MSLGALRQIQLTGLERPALVRERELFMVMGKGLVCAEIYAGGSALTSWRWIMTFHHWTLSSSSA